MADERRPLEGPAARRVRLAQLAREGQPVKFEAGEAERAAMARRLGLLSIESLAADLVASPWRRDGASLRGRLRAEITQESVVSLQPLRRSIDETVDRTFLPAGSQPLPGSRNASGEVEIEIDPEGDDPPDVLEGDAIEILEMVEEALALAIDPYPREASEVFVAEEPKEREDERRPSPFAGLAKLKDDRTDG